MRITVAGFDWDEGNRAKCQKHGVSIAEVEALLSDDPRVAPDLSHSARGGQVHRRRQEREGPRAVRRLHLPDEGG